MEEYFWLNALFSKKGQQVPISYVFNTKKGRFKSTNAHERLKYYLKIAGLRDDSISCHSFNHGWAVKALDAGISK